jgi:RNA polymerase sigma factor (sigma-70 family)
MENANFLELLERCQKNDRLSQEQLYRLYYNYGMTVASRYASNRDDASEIMNDAFVRAMQNLDKYKREYPFKAWFGRILVNCSINHYRKFTVHRIDTQSITYAEEQSFDSNVLSHLSAQDILRLVQQLPQAYRLAFNLYAIEGFSHAEIAEKLGISEGTSKSNLFKARAKLMQMLEEQRKNEQRNSDAYTDESETLKDDNSMGLRRIK